VGSPREPEQKLPDQIRESHGFFQRGFQHVAVFIHSSRARQSHFSFAADVVDRGSQIVRYVC